MTTPHQPQPHTDGIPEDIRITASEIVADWFMNGANRPFVDELAKAILAERKRNELDEGIEKILADDSPPEKANILEFELGVTKGKNRILSKALLDLLYVYESDFDEAAPKRPDWLRTAILIASEHEPPSTTQSQTGRQSDV